MNLHDWAIKWRIPMECLRDLQTTMGTFTPPVPESHPKDRTSEAYVQSVVRLEASRKGVKLWRNNSGALVPKHSKTPVRFGLANDSEKMNDIIKSADLVGVRAVVVKPEHVGHVIGQFVSRECKPVGWQYAGDPHEAAQLAWANVINAHGGDASFVTGEGSL